MDDGKLIQDYVARNSETAFRELVNRYLKLVHSAALRQVRDPQLAEDVTQAVFILLARKAASFQTNIVLAGWLYRTTRFVAARAVRSEQRRRQRDQEAFHMQQISASDDAWYCLAPMLDEAVGQLDKTDRNAVLLRFFQDEPLRKIGDTLGISEEAARKRVGRSIEKLRLFFTRRGFSISAALLSTVLAEHSAKAAPLRAGDAIAQAAFAHGSAANAVLPAVVTETLQAWRWAAPKIAAGLATFAVASALVVANRATLFRHSPDRAAASLQPAVPASAPVKTKAAIAPGSPRNFFHFAFRAVDAETGAGLPHARVMSMAFALPDKVKMETNLVTDAEGRCDVPVPFSKPAGLYVAVVADGYEERCMLAGAKEPMPEGGVLKLHPGSRIGGVVQDESGRPVAGAAIEVSFYGTGDSSNRELQRERPGFPGDDIVSATTDSAGRWTFGSGPTNGAFQITVKHPAFPKADFQNDGDTQMASVGDALKLDDLHAGTAVLVLKAGLSLRGTVTDEYGYHLAGAKVSQGRFFPESHAIATESDGSFVLPNLSPGENFITITADGFAPQRIEMQVSAQTPPLAVQLKPGKVLRLRVLDKNGSPMAKAMVGVERWQGPNTLEWRAWTDSGGRVVWNSAPLEPVTFSVGKDGYFYSRQNTLAADGQEHIVTLRPQLMVVGSVTDAGTKQPISEFKAIPGSERHNLVHGTNGQYKLVFEEYSPPLQVRFEADGYEPAVSPPLESDATNLTCNIALQKQDAVNAVQGVVLLPDGTPAAGAHVALLTADKRVILARAKFLSRGDELIVDANADGRFSFPPEAAPASVLAIDERGFGRVAVDNTNHMVSIQLQPLGRIEGTLQLKRQSNAAQKIIMRGGLVGVSVDGAAFSTMTDEQGNFVFEQIPPGDFTLFVDRGEGIPYSHPTPVEVQAGTTVRAQIGGASGENAE